MKRLRYLPVLLLSVAVAAGTALPVMAQPGVGVGAKPPEGALVLFDGTRKMLDEKWTFWEGPRFASALPI